MKYLDQVIKETQKLSVSSYNRTEDIGKSDSRWEDTTCNLVPNVNLIIPGHARFGVLAAVLVRIRVLLDMKLCLFTDGSWHFDNHSEVFDCLIIEENVTTILWNFRKLPPTDTNSEIGRNVS